MEQANYKETIAHSAEVEFVHKKQLGGAGEFAVVSLRLEPLARGAGIVFVNEVDCVPEFLEAIETTIRHCASKGGYSGYPITDIRATLIGVKYHEIDSNGRTFAIATEGAFYEALHKANPILIH